MMELHQGRICISPEVTFHNDFTMASIIMAFNNTRFFR